MDLEKKAIEENKVTKPSDNVITSKETPPYPFRLGVTLVILASFLFAGALYYGIIKL